MLTVIPVHTVCRSALLRACALACAVTLASPQAAAANACSQPVRMATGQWEPYSYYDAQGRFTGIDADMVRAIFKEAGCELTELPPMPPERNHHLFHKGGVDLIAGATATPARRKTALFSRPYRRETIGLFALGDRFDQYLSVRSFGAFLGRPYTMLAPKVGWYGEAYERQVSMLRERGRLSQFVDFTLGMKMLAAGRAQFILGDSASIEHTAVREGVTVRPLPFWLVDDDVRLMLSRAAVTKADVGRIDAAIVRLRQRGVFEQIRRSYGGH